MESMTWAKLKAFLKECFQVILWWVVMEISIHYFYCTAIQQVHNNHVSISQRGDIPNQRVHDNLVYIQQNGDSPHQYVRDNHPHVPRRGQFFVTAK